MSGLGLQFDHAQYEGTSSGAPCALCGQPVSGTYFEVNGKVACAACNGRLQQSITSEGRAGRAARATIYGLGAAALGAAIWYAVRTATGYEVGLIAIVVGVLVGTAVKRGSGGRGGWGYQTLAVALTYLSIVSTYVPVIVVSLRDKLKEDQAAKPKPTEEPAKVGLGKALVMVAVGLTALLAFACIAPFLGGAQSVIGIFIIGIGLYEAWKINRRVPIVITGPHRVAPPAAPAAPGG